jgi:hypothetical protein
VYCHIRALALRGRGEQPSRLYFVFKKAAIPKKAAASKKKADHPRPPPSKGRKGRVQFKAAAARS